MRARPTEGGEALGMLVSKPQREPDILFFYLFFNLCPCTRTSSSTRCPSTRSSSFLFSSSSSVPLFLSPARKGQQGRGATAAVTAVPGPLLGQTPHHRHNTARRASSRDPCGAPRKLKDYSRSVPGASRSDEPAPAPPPPPHRRPKELELAF